MRNNNRIKPYCDALAHIWEQVPNWRLAQLMINAIEAYKRDYGTDPFYVEDQEFLTYLYNYINKFTS